MKNAAPRTKTSWTKWIVMIIVFVASFAIFSEIFSDWEHFKAGLFGTSPPE